MLDKHLLKTAPKPPLAFGQPDFVLAPLVHRHHRDAGMHPAQDLRLRIRRNAIAEPPQGRVQLAQEPLAAIDRQRQLDRTKRGYLFAADATTNPTASQQRGLQAALGLTKAGPHVLWHDSSDIADCQENVPQRAGITPSAEALPAPAPKFVHAVVSQAPGGS
jgi:hypothetical protein